MTERQDRHKFCKVYSNPLKLTNNATMHGKQYDRIAIKNFEKLGME